MEPDPSADRIIEVFDGARDLPAGAERERFLSEACRDDPLLKEEVLSLLEAHRAAGDFLSNAALSGSAGEAEKPGDRIGPYKLLEQIGEGGCGVVYMAEQEEPVRRRVALKVIKLGMDTRQVIARFEAERQALALMDHPNIARVFDGGATVTGRPYFVMELVRGVKITSYCDQNRLSTSDRIALFIKLCQAIEHAHQKGIIHRDIKPSNVLVAQHDTEAVPKVIDFGIAKATTGQLTDKTLFTAFLQFMGTPAYMSPEQARMSGLDIDTRTDIYSLGVLFYELITGHPPFDPEKLCASGFDEIRRIILEEEPPTPSRRLSTINGAELTTVAASRHTQPLRLLSLVRGDLDWIVMKCLDKNRARRYETASALALDLQRHLKNEPVLACPPSAIYRARKFARRNKAGLAIASALGLAALFIVAELAISNQRVVREKDRTEAALTQALEQKERADRNLSRARQAVKDYLLKTSENPLLQSGDFQALRQDLLQSAIPFYEEFVRQDRQDPSLELEQGLAHDDLGFLRQELGDKERAVEDFEAAQRILGRLSASFPDHPVYRLRLVESHNNRASALDDLGRLDAAEAEYRLALTLVEQLIAERGPASDRLESLSRVQGNLGLLLQESGRLPDAEPLLRRTIATREKLLEGQPDSLPLRGQLANSWNNLGALLRAQRKPEDAEQAFERVLEILGSEEPGHPRNGASEQKLYLRLQQGRARAWNNLGMIRNQTARHADAERAFREALAIKQTLADRFPSVPAYRRDLASSLNNLGTVLSSAKREDEARSAYEKAIELYEKLAADSPGDALHAVELAGTYSNMGRLIGDRGQLEQSLPWLAKSIDGLEAAMSRDERVAKVRESLCVARWTRAMTLAELDRFSEALKDWDRAIEVDDGRYRQQLRLRRASNLLQMKEYARATADAAAIAEAANATAEDIYNAACVYALSAELTGPADTPGPDSHAHEAVLLLRRAVSRGFKDRAHIEADPDLKALRSREDFRKLIEELGGGSSGPQDGKQD